MPNITVGKNTLMTADGKYIVSACDGHIMYGTGCFNVEDTVTVKSDLDISVGNIDFFGDIYIKGNVMEGFSVKAGRSLKIEGTVFSADLAAGGDITIAITSQAGRTMSYTLSVAALEESIEPETDSTYARYTMYVLDGEWEFNIDALQDVFDPEAKNIADLSDYCASRDSAYYDGGIIKASRPLVSNGTDMLYSEGRRTEYPGFVFTAYDLKQGQSLITVGISYPSKEYGKTSTLRRVEELLRGIELTQPEETAGTAE